VKWSRPDATTLCQTSRTSHRPGGNGLGCDQRPSENPLKSGVAWQAVLPGLVRGGLTQSPQRSAPPLSRGLRCATMRAMPRALHAATAVPPLGCPHPHHACGCTFTLQPPSSSGDRPSVSGPPLFSPSRRPAPPHRCPRGPSGFGPTAPCGAAPFAEAATPRAPPSSSPSTTAAAAGTAAAPLVDCLIGSTTAAATPSAPPPPPSSTRIPTPAPARLSRRASNDGWAKGRRR